MPLLDSINRPDDLRRLSSDELTSLAAEIRRFLITNVSRTGGHLGPNLGVVELTIALHLVFDSPRDPIVFDTGHQSYVHKILTGRREAFPTLRRKDGLSGYPSRAESGHDWVENSHASASLGWAHGLAQGFRLQGASDRTVVAVIGDGALTGGMVWEALNNIAVTELPMVIVVNDNGRSYAPTVGGLSAHLSAIRTSPHYEPTLDTIRTSIRRTPVVGRPAYELLHGVKAGLKDVLAPQGLFSDLDIKYVGPVDGHDIGALVLALRQAKGFGRPVIVHAITQKGRGFRAAEQYEIDLFHSIGPIDAVTGAPINPSSHATWTEVFGQEMVELGESDPKLVALTAAMLHPVGLARFAAVYPERVFDVGIAEQHAMTYAAGLARTGLHPVFAVYSTFLNRALDQLVMDVGLHHLPVTIVCDRAGVTGSDGASHNGVWDVALAGIVPGLRLAAPRDQPRLHAALEAATTRRDGPTLIRYAKGRLPDPLPAVTTREGLDHLVFTEQKNVLIVAWGSMCQVAVEAAKLLEREGIAAGVVDPVWGLPVSDALVELCSGYRMVATIEDDLIVGGLGSRLALAMSDAGVDVPVRHFGVPQEYLPAASRAEVLADIGLTPGAVARSIIEAVAVDENDSADDRLPDDRLPGAR